MVRPSGSPVQVDAEAQAGAAQVDHVALVVGELEAQVPQRDRAPDVDHVVLVRVRLHDVAHALLADDLGDDVVAQRPHRVGRVGQAAAAKVDLRVGLKVKTCWLPASFTKLGPSRWLMLRGLLGVAPWG